MMKEQGPTALMLYTGACFFITAFGYWAGLVRLRRADQAGGSVLREGILVMALSLALAGLFPSILMASPVLALGAFGLGLAWSERQWREFHDSTNDNRDSYLALLQMAVTTIGVLAPVVVAGLLAWKASRPMTVLLMVGAALFGATLTVRPRLAAHPCQPFRAWPPKLPSGFWKQGTYFVFDGMGEILRSAIFVAGVVTVLRNLAPYNLATAVTSLFTALALAWIAKHQSAQNRLHRLALALGLSALAWVTLAVALGHSAAFPVFLVLYSFSIPLLQATKHSLIIKGLSQPGQSLEESTMTREWLLMLVRVPAMAMAAFVTYLSRSPLQSVTILCVLLVAMAPLEFWSARAVHREP